MNFENKLIGIDNDGEDVICDNSIFDSDYNDEEIGQAIYRGELFNYEEGNYLEYYVCLDKNSQKNIFIEDFDIVKRSKGIGTLYFKELEEIGKNLSCEYITGKLTNYDDVGDTNYKKRVNFYVNKNDCFLIKDDKYFKKDLI